MTDGNFYHFLKISDSPLAQPLMADMFSVSLHSPEQSGTKPKLVAKILVTNDGDRLCIGYQN